MTEPLLDYATSLYKSMEEETLGHNTLPHNATPGTANVRCCTESQRSLLPLAEMHMQGGEWEGELRRRPIGCVPFDQVSRCGAARC